MAEWRRKKEEGEGLDMRGKMEDEKAGGGFVIHLLGPDSRSILSDPGQSAHISPQSLLSFLFSISTLSFIHLLLPSSSFLWCLCLWPLSHCSLKTGQQAAIPHCTHAASVCPDNNPGNMNFQIWTKNLKCWKSYKTFTHLSVCWAFMFLQSPSIHLLKLLKLDYMNKYLLTFTGKQKCYS